MKKGEIGQSKRNRRTCSTDVFDFVKSVRDEKKKKIEIEEEREEKQKRKKHREPKTRTTVHGSKTK